MLSITVKQGEEVIESIGRQLDALGVRTAAIVSLVGAVDSCAISNMPAEDAMKDIITEFRQPFELSGTGEVKDGKPHIHCVLSGEGNVALAGHLHWARIENWFVNAYVLTNTSALG